MISPIIREDLLYYIWKTKSFDLTDLKTTSKQKISILEFGHQNFDSGPDFSGGKIKIGNTTWAGNVEMHVYSSDWVRHCHDIDKAYDNVILHVVFEHDKEVYTTSEQLIPCLELKDRIPKKILKKYSQLLATNNWIPCEKHISRVEKQTVSFWLQRLVAERIEGKTKYIKHLLENSRSNWEETLYISLATYMGARVNKDPFETLAKSLPLLLLQKNRGELHKVEALIFGQAGMLDGSFKDVYFNSLKKEYRFMSKKYGLKPMSPVSWKFARMRPVGFPTVRLAQFAQMLYKIERLFSQLILENDIKEIKKSLKVSPSTFWNTHYRFGKESKFSEKKIGDGFVDQLIINVICPIMFLYGKQVAEERYCNRAIAHLEALKAEKNNIVRKFSALGIQSKSASDSQALIELKSKYCEEKHCVSCAIGNSIINRKD